MNLNNQRNDIFYLSEGLRLFRKKQFFEAHEAWEWVWKRRADPDKLALQALIIFAAALVHYQRGNMNGVRRSFSKVRKKVQLAKNAYPQQYPLFLDLIERYIPRMKQYLKDPNQFWKIFQQFSQQINLTGL